MKAVHEQDQESWADISVVEEAEVVEQREDGKVKSRQKAPPVIIKL